MKTYIQPSIRILSIQGDPLMEGTMDVDPDQNVSTGGGTGGWTRGFWDWDYVEEEDEH